MVQRAIDACKRFEEAALEAFRSQGYTNTTIAQIAASAGLTERTFFRYFPDKAEVLFSRADWLEADIAGRIRCAQAAVHPLDAIVAALQETGRFFDDNRDKVLIREAVISAHSDLLERELLKMRQLATVIEEALQSRSVPFPVSRMAAETGVLIWRMAIDAWRADPQKRAFGEHVCNCSLTLSELVTRNGITARQGESP